MTIKFKQILLNQILHYMFKEKFEFEESVEEFDSDGEIKKNLAKISELMDGGTRIFKILLYYDENVSVKETEVISQTLLKNQLDYYTVDFKSIQDADFEILILPPCNINENILGLIKTLEEKNIKVLTVMKPEFLPEIKKAVICKNFRICKDEKDLIMNIITSINPDVLLKKEADIFYIKKETDAGYRYLFVNAGNNDVNTAAELYIDKKDNEKEYKITVYNLLTDEKTAVNTEIKGNKAVIDLRLPAYEAVVVIAEIGL